MENMKRLDLVNMSFNPYFIWTMFFIEMIIYNKSIEKLGF